MMEKPKSSAALELAMTDTDTEARLRAVLADVDAHVTAALQAVTLTAYESTDGRNWQETDRITIAAELERIDAALGPKGESMFAALAQDIDELVVELRAAKARLKQVTPESNVGPENA